MTKPSRRASNGRETPLGEIAPIFSKHARDSGVSGASAAPVTTASASPCWIIRSAVPIAWLPAAHAETTLKTGFGARADKIPVSSTKSAIGHLLGAAGAVEAVATVLALRDRVAPPTINWEEADEDLDLDYVPGSARPLEMANGRPPVALSNSFGFGGHNATLCLEAV